MTRPSVVSDWLIEIDSCRRSMSSPAALNRSEPARSTRLAATRLGGRAGARGHRQREREDGVRARRRGVDRGGGDDAVLLRLCHQLLQLGRREDATLGEPLHVDAARLRPPQLELGAALRLEQVVEPLVVQLGVRDEDARALVHRRALEQLAPKPRDDAGLVGRAEHRVRLARARLAVREDGAVVPVEERLHRLRDERVVHRVLRLLRPERAVEREDRARRQIGPNRSRRRPRRRPSPRRAPAAGSARRPAAPSSWRTSPLAGGVLGEARGQQSDALVEFGRSTFRRCPPPRCREIGTHAAMAVAELPRGLVVAIARAAKHGVVLTTMLQVCRTWRIRAERGDRQPVARDGAAQFPRCTASGRRAQAPATARCTATLDDQAGARSGYPSSMLSPAEWMAPGTLLTDRTSDVDERGADLTISPRAPWLPDPLGLIAPQDDTTRI